MLCDQSWIDPDLDDTNGIQVREQRDMLRLESQILNVQLHIRKSLTVSSPLQLSALPIYQLSLLSIMLLPAGRLLPMECI